METVGIITFHETINYGGLLQAYALQKVLTDLGYDARLIDYCNPHRGTTTLSSYHLLRHFVWNNIVKRLLVGQGRLRATEAFKSGFFDLSSVQYHDAETLHASPPEYDGYITGSDQVWNPRNNNFDSSYFLTFAPHGKKRISYAASFGISKVPDRYCRDYAGWLKQFDYLSVREREGQEIIEQLTGRIAEVVLDPTLLLSREQWNEVAVSRARENYILCYYMPGDRKVTDWITRTARRLSVMTGWRIIEIGQKEYMKFLFWRHFIFSAGPAEFVGLFQNASFVITNSFHGTAFAINYQKPFLVPVNRNLPPEKTLSSRITHLLKTLGMEHRLSTVDDEMPIDDVFEIDFLSAESLLQKEKHRSIHFLKQALGEK